MEKDIQLEKSMKAIDDFANEMEQVYRNTPNAKFGCIQLSIRCEILLDMICQIYESIEKDNKNIQIIRECHELIAPFLTRYRQILTRMEII